MTQESLKYKTMLGVVWRFIERFLAQIVSMVVSIILARLLTPEDYGVVAIISIFTSLCSILVTQGFSAALVQKKNADDMDFSTVFFLSVLLSTVLYVVLFLGAPFISEFYNLPILSPLLRVMGVIIPFSAVSSIQTAIISRTFAFKKSLLTTLLATIISAVIGIYMAYAGYGAWALCGQYVSNIVISSLLMMLVLRWYPKPMFSIKRAVEMFSYGWKLLAASLLEALNVDLKSFFIGKYYSSADLAQYNRGKQFPVLINTNINDSISVVLFSAFSVQQDNYIQLKSSLKRALQLSTFIIFPIQLGLAVVAEPLTLLLLTEKWLPSAVYMQIMCVCYCFTPIFTANAQVLKAIGESKYYLLSATISNIIGILIVLGTIRFGVIYVALGGVLTTVIMTISYSALCGKRIGYGPCRQLIDLVPNIINAAVMTICTYIVGFMVEHIVLKLFVQIVIGVIVYIGTSFLLKNESMIYCIDLIQTILNRKKV